MVFAETSIDCAETDMLTQQPLVWLLLELLELPEPAPVALAGEGSPPPPPPQPLARSAAAASAAQRRVSCNADTECGLAARREIDDIAGSLVGTDWPALLSGLVRFYTSDERILHHGHGKGNATLRKDYRAAVIALRYR